MDDSDARHIVIVGAGFSGLMIAAAQARLYAGLHAQNRGLPPLHISLIEKRADTGGTAYGTDDDVFTLNQPAGEMSPFADQPDHFSRWLGSGEAAFATRKQYGEYLRETFREAFAEAARRGARVTCDVICDEARGIDLSREDVVAVDTGRNGTLKGSALVLAEGHCHAPFLRELEKEPGYFSFPYSVAGVAAALEKDDHGKIALIGTGQSMLDALAALDRLEYKGAIYAVSRHLVEPWPYHPGSHGADKAPYTAQFLTARAVQNGEIFSGRDMIKALQQEIGHAQGSGHDVDHALNAIDLHALAQAGPEGGAPEGLEELRTVWKAYYGNPTSPERHALFAGYKSRGQLVLVEGAVKEDGIEAVAGGFRLKHMGDKGEDLTVSALFNCAAFSRDPLAAPLLRQARAQRALRFSFNGAVAAGEQEHRGLFVAGPAASPDKWGVGSFRNNNAAIARLGLQRALGVTIDI